MNKKKYQNENEYTFQKWKLDYKNDYLIVIKGAKVNVL